MAVSNANKDEETQEEHENSHIATLHDQAHLQRSGTSNIVSIRSLGSGSYATVDLVTMSVQGTRKLLVRKMLLQAGIESTPGTGVQQDNNSIQAVVASQLKPSSQQDWTREANMHRECAQCPFVLQLLAAKRCKSGNLLLLLEYAAQGSLTDILAARKLQLQLQASSAGGVLRLPAPDAAAEAAAVVQPSRKEVGLVAEQLQQTVEGSRLSSCGTATVVQADVDQQVDLVLPLAVTAAHIIQEDAGVVDDITPGCNTTTPGPLAFQRQQGQSLLQQPHTAINDEPVLVTLLEDASLLSTQLMQEHSVTAVNPPDLLGAATIELPSAAAVLEGLHPVSHGLSEESARFYAACILTALKTLHSRRILHRDIKPCNLLLFHDGYLKLADLGCCCQLPEGVSGAHTRTGTAGYMAPEVLAGTEAYSYPVDMWSLGIVIWQMVAGSLPAWSAQQEQQQHEGLHWAPDKLEFPRYFSKDLCSLLDGLLHHDSSARLDIDAVTSSAWFKGFDWQALQQKTMEPPVLDALPVKPR